MLKKTNIDNDEIKVVRGIEVELKWGGEAGSKVGLLNRWS